LHNVQPRDSSSCELNKIFEIKKTLHFDDKSQKNMRVFLVEKREKQGKVLKELELRPHNDIRYFTLKAKESVLIQWSYSHKLGKYPQIVPDGLLPNTNDCKHKDYEKFYSRCHNSQFSFYFMNTCNEFLQLDMVEYATISPLKLDYVVRSLGDQTSKKSFRKEITKPPMVMY
jgi:hypothetical protein